MFFDDAAALEVRILDQSKVHSASRVTNFTPYFKETMVFSTGMVGGKPDGAAVEGILDEFEYEMSSCGEDADVPEKPSEVAADKAPAAKDQPLDPSIFPEGEEAVPPPPGPHPEA